jgi:hypothetical protein
MIEMDRFGISTLADLTDRVKLSRLLEPLQTAIDELLFYDYTIQEKNLPTHKRIILTQGRVPTYWNDLKKKNPDNYYKKRNRFRELVNQFGKQNIQETISNLVTQKWNGLLQSDQQTFQELTDPLKTNFPGSNR